MRAWLGLSLTLLLLPACAFDSGPSTKDVQFLRDPASGLCMPIPVPVCDSSGCDASAAQPWSSWQPCADPCAGLGEAECRADPRCIARYDGGTCPAGAACAPAKFVACEANPQPDRCLGLDETTCGATAGCQPVYGSEPCACTDGTPDASGGVACACPATKSYRGCVTATTPATCFGDGECGPGTHCSTRDGDCKPPPGCLPGMACPAVCAGVCVPDVKVCVSDLDCGPDLHCSTSDGDCKPPPGCLPNMACPAVCTGICVPDVIAGCFSIHDERTCVSHAECEPVYVGSRCFCDAQGCGCLEYTFDSCRPKPSPVPVCHAPGLPEDAIGTWKSTDGGIARVYVFDPSGSFRVDDLIAPCPDGSMCATPVWSGIISNHGKWALEPRDSPGVIVKLVYDQPMQSFDRLRFPTLLASKGCGAEELLVEIDTGRAFARK